MNISAALSLIESSNVKTRKEGFNDLNRVLRANARDIKRLFPKTRVLSDFFERLTKQVSNDRRSYLSAKASDTRTSRTTSESKFNDSIRACRHAVEVTVPILRYKPVSLLIDCYLEWFGDNDGQVCMLVARDCVKSINEILSYRPHLEHLAGEQWVRLCKRLCKYIEDLSHASSTLNTPQRHIFVEVARLLQTMTAIPFPTIDANASFICRSLLKHLDRTAQISDADFLLLFAFNSVLRHAVIEAFSNVRTDLFMCLRTIAKLWVRDNTRRNDLKDELLRTLVVLLPFIEDAVRSPGPDINIREHARELYELLMETSSSSSLAELMQPEDLRLTIADEPDDWHLPCCQMTSHQIRAHRAWVTISLLVNLLTLAKKPMSQASDVQPVGSPRVKRARRQSVHQELIRLAKDPHAPAAIVGLQALLFYSQQFRCDEESLQDVVEYLLLRTDDNKPIVASWAYIALAGCACQTSAKAMSLKPIWTTLWTKATRALKTAAICRAASYIMHVLMSFSLVSRTTISGLLTSFKTSLDILGPTSFDDGSTAMLRSLVSFCQRNRPASFQDLSKGTLTWMFATWDAGSAGIEVGQEIRVNDLIRLVAECIQSQAVDDLDIFTHTTAFSKAYEWIKNTKAALEYLLDLEQDSNHLQTVSVPKPRPRIGEKIDSHEAAPAILQRLLLQRISQTTEAWEEVSNRKESIVSETFVHNSCLALGLCEWLATTTNSPRSPENVKAALLHLLKLLCHHLEGFVAADSPKLETALSILLRVSPELKDPDERNEAQQSVNFCRDWSSEVSKIARKYGSQAITINGNDASLHSSGWDNDDFEQLDGPPKRSIADGDRGNHCLARLLSTSSLDDLEDELRNMTALEIVDSGTFVLRLRQLEIRAHVRMASILLNVFAESVLANYMVERSEDCAVLILQSLLDIFDTWIDPAQSDLLSLAQDICDYYRQASESGQMSSRAQMVFVDLLIKIWQRDPGFGQDGDASNPSVRTTLFKVVATCSLHVRYYISVHIPVIFGFFTAANHDAVFDDLSSNMDTSIEPAEVVGIRIAFLANIAIKWQTLLRKSIFYIFEAAGTAPDSLTYATRAISRVASAHSFTDPGALFASFGPQLVFTWMSSQRDDTALEDMPFEIFGFATLDDMLKQSEGELVAQSAIFKKPEVIVTLQTRLHKTELAIIKESFVDIITYAIAHDVSSKQSSATVEQQIRDLFTAKDEYLTLLKSRLPNIIARLILATELDGGVERHWEKTTDYQYAHQAIQAMLVFANDPRPAVPNLQPAFKGRHLMYGLERIARRAGLSIYQLFDGPLFLAVARHMLDAMNPSLGSLHCRNIIQKIRWLCALTKANEGLAYPMHMLIHTLRPYILDAQCVNDVFGVLHHAYASSGIESSDRTASVLKSLQTISFAVSQQDEEWIADTQHQTTTSNLEKMRTWLVELGHNSSKQTPSDRGKPSVRLIDLAAKLTHPALFDSDTPATQLLRHLLDPGLCPPTVLPARERDDVVRHLVTHSIGADVNRDGFVTLSDAATYADTLARICQAVTLPEGARVWLGRLVGRYYSATGGTLEIKADRKELVDHQDDERTFETAVTRSRSTIISMLVEHLAGQVPAHASAAERALRGIIEAQPRKGDVKHVSSMMPDQVLQALQLRFATEETVQSDGEAQDRAFDPRAKSSVDIFARQVVCLAIKACSHDPYLQPLLRAVRQIDGFAEKTFSSVLHLALANGLEAQNDVRDDLSSTASSLFYGSRDAKARVMLQLIIFLLDQPVIGETTQLDRAKWLEVDYKLAAEAAVAADWPTAALLLIELADRPAPRASMNSRRASVSSQTQASQTHEELLLSIFNSLEDPDSFYGIKRPATIETMAAEIDHEDDPRGSLRIHSDLLNTDGSQEIHAPQLVSALSRLRMDHLASALSQQGGPKTAAQSSLALTTARRLYEWDIQPPETSSPSNILFEAYQSLAEMSSSTSMVSALDADLAAVSGMMLQRAQTATLQVLSVLSDMQMILTNGDAAATKQSLLEADRAQEKWEKADQRELLELLSHRQSIVGILRRNTDAHQKTLTLTDCLEMEVRSALQVCKTASKMSASEHWFNEALALYRAEDLYSSNGLRVSAAVTMELACAMWEVRKDRHSIALLQSLILRSDLNKEMIPVQRAVIYATLGRQIAEIRFEKPEDIISKYLKVALDQIGKGIDADDEAMICYEFAHFCDRQLLESDITSEMQRLQRLREKRITELRKLEQMSKQVPASDKQTKADIARKHRKERSWYDLDDADFKKSRIALHNFVQQAIRNYLRALSVSDKYNRVVVRFFALWMEHSELAEANQAVSAYLERAPSWKFVTLLTQMLSRREDNNSPFQSLLDKLIGRMCKKHPYHCVFPLFSSCHAAINAGDAKATSRKQAACNMADNIQKDKHLGSLFRSVWSANKVYDTFAQAKYDKVGRTNLKSVPGGRNVERLATETNLPPPTFSPPLRPNGDYNNIPTVQRFRSQITVASGISAPKILTAVASDGQYYKMLCKGGNDDLRQDAIMEQVFTSVSATLKKHEATRKRNLGIRTYAVLPLTSNSGIIEFVPNSIPLHDYLIPAHEKYHPKDMKWNKAREMIKNVQESSRDTRIKAFVEVTKKYNPVLRYFFLERFPDPTEWYERRLAYSRSTAAISILGHVLGLGDRHCHNILLDERSGEAVHIDLGIAFETGRVLPVPEVVPFRLTRDIVDGMGVTGVEGVFRRCCEFTLEALRTEKAGIMTILDVLRYDPLYAWSITPVKARRMQGETGEEVARDEGDGESGEAERALGVVEKKLGAGLSKEAAVRELIQVAGDEKNLALLFAGWAAYN